MKFLLVDDEFDSRKKAQKMLSQYGECHVAVNGLEALNAFVIAHKENDPYNLIFLDCEMPDFDGFQVHQKIRQWETSKNTQDSERVKIVLLSLKETQKTSPLNPAPGIETFMQKSVNQDKLSTAFKQINYL